MGGAFIQPSTWFTCSLRAEQDKDRKDEQRRREGSAKKPSQ
jgi:hypothetical protein